MKRLILCGPPFSGKTTFGNLAAARLKCNFFDTDRLIEEFFFKEKTKFLSFREIYTQYGESFFRELEKQVILKLEEKQGIIALGGGTLQIEENRLKLSQLAPLIYLKTPFETLFERLSKNQLPAYLKNEKNPRQAFQKKVETRLKTFEDMAKKTIDTEVLSKEEILLKICEYYGE